MPDSLRPVNQPFSSDWTEYIAGFRKGIEVNREMITSVQEVQREIAKIGDVFKGLPDRKTVRLSVEGADSALAEIAKVKAALDSLGDRRVFIGGGNEAMVRELRDISASMDMATSSMGRMEDHLTVISRNVQDSSADLMMQTQILRDNADAHRAAAVAAAGLAAATGGRGGGGGAVIPLPAGGGGGGGGGAGGFVPWAGGGWQAVRFWGMMGAEIASTVVPALVAAGSAALVGAQGFEQLQTRAQAIYTVSEALGPSLNQSFGQFVVGGKYGGALQQAQNQAQGAVYGIAGAGINLLQGGAGQGLLGMGVQTIDMLNRSAAQFVLSAQQRGLGGQLAGLVGGGPGYLQQFGQVGANLGNILLGVGPNLPGVGADLLSALVGGTGVLAAGAQNIPGPLIGSLLAYEAASRWGPALLGGQGLIGRALGLRGVGGLGGLISKGGIALGGLGESGSTLESLGLGISGVGEGLAGLAGWPVGVAGIFAYLMGKGFTAKNLPAERIAAAQAGIAGAGFAGAFAPLGAAITQMGGFAGVVGQTAGQPGRLGLPADISSDPRAAYRAGIVRQDAQQYSAAASSFSSLMGQLVASGPQLVSALRKAGLNTGSMADAFMIAQNAGLDLSHSFDAHGKLTAVAVQQLKDYTAAIAPMTKSTGAFGAAVSAQYIMSQPAMQNVAKVNQAFDAYGQIITGGPLGAAGLVGALGSIGATLGPSLAPLTAAQAAAGGVQGPASTRQIAHALANVLTPGGAAAWTAFAGAPGGVPGPVQAEQANLDQLRTALALGAIGQGGAAGLAGFQLRQMLPLARQSPAALATLMQQGAQMGVTGYYDPSKSLAQNYQAAAAAIAKVADGAKAANAATQGMTVNLSRLPQVAQQFVGGLNANIMAQQLTNASKAVGQISQSAGKGLVDKGALSSLVGDFRTAGIQGAANIKASLDAALKTAGVSQAMRIKIEAQVTADTSAAQAAIKAVHPSPVTIPVHESGVSAAQAAINSVQGKTVTITVNEVLRVTGGGSGGTVAGQVGLGAGRYMTTMQTGGLVPGSGFGDVVPAMLEPGEAIIPRYLVPMIAPILARYRVPGFGGAPMGTSGHFAVGGAVGVPPTWLNPGGHAAAVAGQFAVTIIEEIAKAIRNTAEAKKIAQALVGKIGQEVAFAKNVTSAAMAGQGFGTTGLLSTFDTTGGTVAQQMQTYLTTVTSFTSDLAALRKGHLNKALISQLIAAGPVAGDQLAQSILGGGTTTGGASSIAQVNALWAQITKASHGLGAQAAMAMYGGRLDPNLRSGQFSGGGVTVNINVGGSGGLGGMTDAQIKALVEKIQTALLKQAKRSGKTGLALPRPYNT